MTIPNHSRSLAVVHWLGAAIVFGTCIPIAASSQVARGFHQRFTTLSALPDVSLSIELTHLVTLRGSVSEGNISLRSRVRQGDSGRYFVAPTYDQSKIAVYNRTGKYIRSIGRIGQGPGELLGINDFVVTPRNEICVFDWRLNRASYFSVRGKFIDSFQLPGLVHSAVVLSDGKMILQMTVQSPDLVGVPIHVVSSDGEIINSFGSDDISFNARNIDLYVRILAIYDDTHILAAPLNEYKIELWDVNGHLERTLTRDSEWFPTWNTVDRNQPFSSRPSPRLVGLRTDESGHIWTLVAVADRAWSPRSDYTHEISLSDLETLFDYQMEVLNLQSGQVMASQKYDAPIAFLGPSKVTRMLQDENGNINVEVLSIRLKPTDQLRR